MNLNSNDYKSMICARADHIRMALYPAGQAVNAPPPDVVPDFNMLKSLLNELIELTQAFETSLGPA